MYRLVTVSKNCFFIFLYIYIYIYVKYEESAIRKNKNKIKEKEKSSVGWSHTLFTCCTPPLCQKSVLSELNKTLSGKTRALPWTKR
jgi:hypothetical protein